MEITGVERRHRWRLEEKLRIVAETERPGVGIGEIARRYEISRGLLWNWRSQVRRGVLRTEPAPVFLPVQMISERAGGDEMKRIGPSSAAGADPTRTPKSSASADLSSRYAETALSSKEKQWTRSSNIGDRIKAHQCDHFAAD